MKAIKGRILKFLIFIISSTLYSFDFPNSTDLYYYKSENKKNQFNSIQVFSFDSIPTKLVLSKNSIHIEMQIVLKDKNLKNCLFDKNQFCNLYKKSKKNQLQFNSTNQKNKLQASLAYPIKSKFIEINFKNKTKKYKEKFKIHSFAYINCFDGLCFPQVGVIGESFESLNYDFSGRSFEYYNFHKLQEIEQEKKKVFLSKKELLLEKEKYDKQENRSECDLKFLNSKFFSVICKNDDHGSVYNTSYDNFLIYNGKEA